jgi:hypothetical protein
MNLKLNKNQCLDLLDYQRQLKKKFGIILAEYNRIEYFNLQIQLTLVKDFLIGKKSLKKYLKLFTNFKNNLINGEEFVNEFLDFYNEDQKFLKNFIFNRENLKDLEIDSHLGGLNSLLEEISIKCDSLESDPDHKLKGEIDEQELRS